MNPGEMNWYMYAMSFAMWFLWPLRLLAQNRRRASPVRLAVRLRTRHLLRRRGMELVEALPDAIFNVCRNLSQERVEDVRV